MMGFLEFGWVEFTIWEGFIEFGCRGFCMVWDAFTICDGLYQRGVRMEIWRWL
jgi:hypothetical protein